MPPTTTPQDGWTNSPLRCPACGGGNLHQEAINAFSRVGDVATGIRITIRDGIVSTFVSDKPIISSYCLTLSFLCKQCNEKPLLSVIQGNGENYLSWHTVGKSAADASPSDPH